jgi:glutamate-1-semialdehyde aminotransferase
MQALTADRIAAMDAAAEQLRTALAAKAAAAGLEVVVSGMSSVAGISFAADPSRHEDDPSALGLSSLFHLAANSEGVLLGPGGIFAVSTAHDAEAIEFAVGALGNALDRAAEWLAARQAGG